MEIILNGERTEISSNTTLSQLVETMAKDTSGMAVAVNNSVVPKSDWESTQLNPGDKVLLIIASQGG